MIMFLRIFCTFQQALYMYYCFLMICLGKNVINMTLKYRNIILRDESALKEFQIKRFLNSI